MAENKAFEDAREPPFEPALGPAGSSLTGSTLPGGGRSSAHFCAIACVFECGLGVIGLAVARLLGLSLDTLLLVPREAPTSPAAAVGCGLLAALPLFGGLVLLQRRPPALLRRFRDQVARQIVPLFRPLNLGQLALIAAASGFGEEVLFRGLLQRGLQTAIGGTSGLLCGLLVAAALFGCCHLLNLPYAVLAGLVGIYFGVLLLATGQLLAPIVAHAAYNLAALIYLTRGTNRPNR